MSTTQGIISALKHLEGQIEGINPKSDTHHGFVCHSPGNGYVPSLEQRRDQNRYFELAITSMPIDDGAAGLSGRRRATVECRVRYEIPFDRSYLFRMIAEDSEYILTKLKGPNYSQVTTGIVSLIPEEPFTEIINIGESEAVLLIFPFTLLYLEA